MSPLISVVKYLISTVQNNLVMSIFHHGQFGIVPLLPGGDLSLGGMVISWRGTWGSCWPVLADPPGFGSQLLSAHICG